MFLGRGVRETGHLARASAMALTLELVRDDALLRALHAIDVTSVVQLRAAMSAALHADDDARAGSADGDERYHYRGGPCALNRALVAAGHAPALAEELERMWRESGGAPLESPDAFTSTLVLMASVLADAMRSRAGTSPEDATTITDDRARLAETLRRLEGPSDVRRSALFGHLARATGLDDASCALAGELASVEITGAFQSDPDPNPHRRPRERLLFTAPHGIFVPRQGERAHVPEEWTTLLATSFARATGGVSVTWSQPERARSKLLRQPDPRLQDPNRVEPARALEHAWGIALERLARDASSGSSSTRACLHVDIHGCRDPSTSATEIGPGDCDIGAAALEAADPALGRRLRAAMGRRLRAFLDAWTREDGDRVGGEGGGEDTFVVNEDPVLTGRRPDGMWTLSQQGTALGLASVQIEMSLRLRRGLRRDEAAMAGFARALADAWVECSEGLAN